MSIIEDGSGSGYSAKVDANNRIHAKSVSVSTQGNSSENGDHYNINTGDITLTSGCESSVLYIKNNEDRDLIVTDIIYLLGNSTGGSGDMQVAIFRNPTVGTVVSDASNVEMKANKNFGSPKTLIADAYKGGEGKTLTNGTVAYRSRLGGASQTYVIKSGDLVLTKGTSVGIKVTPPSGNSSLTIQVAIAAYLRDEE